MQSIQTVTNLTDDDIKKEFRIDSEDIGWASIRGAARLAEIDHSGLAKTLKTAVEQSPSTLATFLIQQGFDPESIILWNKTGVRSNRQHQHFDNVLLELLLKHIDRPALNAVMFIENLVVLRTLNALNAAIK